MQLALEPEDIWKQFYDALRLFANTLQLALSSARFLDNTPEKTIRRYKAELKDFLNRRNAVKHRFGVAVNYSAYEQQHKNRDKTRAAAFPLTISPIMPATPIQKCMPPTGDPVGGIHFLSGTEGESRTCKGLPPAVFESAASINSAIPAKNLVS